MLKQDTKTSSFTELVAMHSGIGFSTVNTLLPRFGMNESWNEKRLKIRAVKRIIIQN